MINQNLLLTGDDGYNLTKSLRFRKSANGYLSRTMNATSTTYTVSVWVKRGLLSGYQYIFASGPNTASNDKGIAFDTSTNQLYAFNGSTQALSTAVFRDPSAWYHVVMSVNSGTASVYVNNVNTGISQSSMSLGTYGRIGRFNDSSSANDFDGYMAEFNLIDGQALTPSSFGETSTTTGVWQPKKYTGTYGTNGFYLPFTDTTSTSTLGTDFSGNSNTWTVNNISLTAGSTYDSMTDVPTLTSATTANYAVMNPLANTSFNTLSNGNLTVYGNSGTDNGIVTSTISMSSGKWYWEHTVTGVTSGYPRLGIMPNAFNINGNVTGNPNGVGYWADGRIVKNTTTLATVATFTTNDVIGVAFDVNALTIYFYKNNTLVYTVTSVTSSSEFFATDCEYNGSGSNVNFGQQPFTYTPPTGFVALNTFNLPTPTIGATASSQADNYFNALTYAGSASNQTISGLDFQPDFIWFKERTTAGIDHNLFDSARSNYGSRLQSNTTNAEAASSAIISVSSTGYSLLGGVSTTNDSSGRTYVTWNWKANGTGVTNTAGSITSTVSANTTAGFSIVTYTGTGSNATVGHGLGVAPSFIIAKARNSAQRWTVYTAALGNGYYGYLNETFAFDTANASLRWNTAPTSSVFGVGTSVDVNNNTTTYVAYCFAPIAGYSAFGSYTGNGSTDGTFVFTGFRPRFVMFKNASAASQWILLDTSRNTYNVANAYLEPNTSDAENTASNVCDILSNGFKIRTTGTDFNDSSNTYIYMAFAENPFKYANAR